MSTTTQIRDRRTAAQLNAVAAVKRQIGQHDPSGGRKYLKEFTEAFRTYQSVIDSRELDTEINRSDIVLVGDYHALPASQSFPATLIEQRAQTADRKIVLAVEAVLARDQHILDQWWRREIIELELRRRTRFDTDWGYDWDAFYHLLITAREYCEAIYGLDCMPREDFRKIPARDHHAAHKIAEIRQRHPRAVIIVLCGESHLAPKHLPQLIRKEMKNECVLTVLQNVDPLYWRAAGEPQPAEAVRVRDDVVCVFNSSPLEKYESYRLWLSRWDSEPGALPDAAPTIYNLIDTLADFLEIDFHAARNGTQPRFLVDLLPEVCSIESVDKFAAQLAREGLSIGEIDLATSRVEDYGSVYVPPVNTLYIRDLRIMFAAEEAARFLHHACRGLPLRGLTRQAKRANSFYGRVLETALGFLGSLLLHPQPNQFDEQPPILLSNITGHESSASSELLGTMLAEALYRGYLKGRIPRSYLRQLFLAQISKPAEAKALFQQAAAKLEKQRRSRA